MDIANIAEPAFTYDPEDPPGYRAGMFRLGPLVGGVEVGATVYELPPGEALCPYHYEWGEEEWLLVLAGTPTLRTPEGERTLAPWDTACFPKGPAGAHAVSNGGAEPARVLMFSNVVYPGVTTYPDSDKVGIWPGSKDDNLLVRRSSGVTYYTDEPPRR
jgi:uncharacterized cupin superfamily protein